MHVHLISANLSTSVRRAAYGAARTFARHGLVRAILHEWRRATAAARRYEQLRSDVAARAQLGIGREDIARQVFDEYYR
jgi:hypothetical protein